MAQAFKFGPSENKILTYIDRQPNHTVYAEEFRTVGQIIASATGVKLANVGGCLRKLNRKQRVALSYRNSRRLKFVSIPTKYHGISEQLSPEAPADKLVRLTSEFLDLVNRRSEIDLLIATCRRNLDRAKDELQRVATE